MTERYTGWPVIWRDSDADIRIIQNRCNTICDGGYDKHSGDYRASVGGETLSSKAMRNTRSWIYSNIESEIRKKKAAEAKAIDSERVSKADKRDGAGPKDDRGGDS